MAHLITQIQAQHPALSSEQLEQVKQVDEYLAANRVH